MERPAITKQTDNNGDPIWVSPGANSQDGMKPLHRCSACYGDVVWVKSNRTGKNYPTDVFKGYHDQRFYMKNSPHFTTCGERQTQRRKRDLMEQAQDLDGYYVGAALWLGVRHPELVEAVCKARDVDRAPLETEWAELGEDVSTLR